MIRGGNKLTIVCLLLALTFPAGAEESAAGEPPVPLEKVIPGWIQLRSGKPLKGVLLLSGFVGTVAAAAIFNYRGNRAYDEYLASVEIPRIVELRRETESRFRTRNWLLIGAAGILVIHFLDLKWTKKNHAKISCDVSAAGFGLHCRLAF